MYTLFTHAKIDQQTYYLRKTHVHTLYACQTLIYTCQTLMYTCQNKLIDLKYENNSYTHSAHMPKSYIHYAYMSNQSTILKI